MASSDMLSLGLDDIIQLNRTTNRRGGTRGLRTQNERGTGGNNYRGRANSGQMVCRNEFERVNIVYFILSSLEHSMGRLATVGKTISIEIVSIHIVTDSVRPVSIVQRSYSFPILIMV
jgi:hypothetical protein